MRNCGEGRVVVDRKTQVWRFELFSSGLEWLHRGFHNMLQSSIEVPQLSPSSPGKSQVGPQRFYNPTTMFCSKSKAVPQGLQTVTTDSNVISQRLFSSTAESHSGSFHCYHSRKRKKQTKKQTPSCLALWSSQATVETEVRIQQ